MKIKRPKEFGRRRERNTAGMDTIKERKRQKEPWPKPRVRHWRNHLKAQTTGRRKDQTEAGKYNERCGGYDLYQEEGAWNPDR